MSYRYLSEKLKSDPQAFNRMRQANNLRTFAALFAMGGGFCVGYNVYSLIKQGEPSYNILAAGVGLFIFTIPLSGGAHIKSAQAVEIYNNNLNPEFIGRLKLETGLSENGLSLRLRF